MKTKTKRLLSCILTGLLALCMALPAMAATAPTGDETAIASVSGLEPGVEAVAYRITEPIIEDGVFKGYRPVSRITSTDGLSITDVTKPSASEVLAISEDIVKNKVSYESASKTGEDTVGELPNVTVTQSFFLKPGYWVVLVTGGKTVYNPILVGAYYKDLSGDDAVMSNDTISADSNFVMAGISGYAKSSNTRFTKFIKDGEELVKGDVLQKGDTVTYVLSAVLPKYTDAYTPDGTTAVLVSVADTMPEDIEATAVTVANGTDAVSDCTATIAADKKSVSVSMDNDYVLAHGGETVTITITGKFTDTPDAEKVNFHPYRNMASMTYVSDIDGATKTFYDFANTYTLGTDTKINGSLTISSNELKKVAVNSNKEEVALPGATFELSGNGKTWTAVSGDDGELVFVGLKEGTYTLKETAAPNGYMLSQDEYTLTVSAVVDAGGNLTNYAINVAKTGVDGTKENAYEASYRYTDVSRMTGSHDVVTLSATSSVTKTTTTNIPNSKMAELPSTGGAGTVILTVVSVAALCGGIALMLFGRKKEVK